MSPITATTDSNIENGTPVSDPRFVISSPDSPRALDANKSQCSSLSDGENYECYGEMDTENGVVTSERLNGLVFPLTFKTNVKMIRKRELTCAIYKREKNRKWFGAEEIMYNLGFETEFH